ncbi:SDR family NAD(P)-dependent oxidoreductase [Streptomyces griseocarneus]|uniref:SDR family NAD(P)-dependent oxidoreductase n=1 Tax=Streptomyces griseocarneus TaxID=51201 RepID=UPI00167DA9DF|nr:SDR family NAD(P)-dependent oxidoreductase [Streptomyces griseocarneus]MBZ6474744.1 SDR family NAD(P)-dependent oxidoreductase [Streptomyces griseocarneus]GHG47872.1 3-hydroxyacyl-CoA dehydrogenase [Streptomyces griseocarneus]
MTGQRRVLDGSLAEAGSVALIPGGTSGLGLATAKRLADGGVFPVLLGRSPERGKLALEHLDGRGAFVPADVADEQGVNAALDVAERHGPLRVVVNCAGTAHAARTVGRDGPMPLRDFQAVMATDLVGTFNVTRLAAERMARLDPVDGQRGVVVNCASVAAYEGQVGQVAYAAAKAGVVGMTLPLARDLAGLRIRVVTVAPGLFETPLTLAAPAELREQFQAHVPHPRRFGRPSEFAALVEHIIANPMLNGETVRLDAALRLPAR